MDSFATSSSLGWGRTETETGFQKTVKYITFSYEYHFAWAIEAGSEQTIKEVSLYQKLLCVSFGKTCLGPLFSDKSHI